MQPNLNKTVLIYSVVTIYIGLRPRINLRFKKTDADKDGHIKEFEYVCDELQTPKHVKLIKNFDRRLKNE